MGGDTLAELLTNLADLLMGRRLGLNGGFDVTVNKILQRLVEIMDAAALGKKCFGFTAVEVVS